MSQFTRHPITKQDIGLHFDYEVQVWVNRDGRVQPCAHPYSMGPRCCNARRFCGKHIEDVHAQFMGDHDDASNIARE